MSQPTEIRIRRAGGDGYAASGGGQRATCAWSPMEAARRVADKITGKNKHRLERLAEQPGDTEKGVLYRFNVVPTPLATGGVCRAWWSGTDEQPEREVMDRKILDKIKKCLRLAQSSNANEAAAAMRQAQKLMEIHGVTADDVAISDVESHTAKAGAGKTPPSHVAMLANMVASAFGAELVYCPLHDGERWHGRFEFYGVSGAAEVAGYAFEVLGRQLKRDRNTFLASLNKRLKRATKVRRGDLYAQAWVNTVARQVVPHQRSEAEDKTIAAYQAKRWEEPLETRQARDNTKGMRSHDYDALRQGHRDGKKVGFHQGVNGKRQAAIGEVTP